MKKTKAFGVAAWVCVCAVTLAGCGAGGTAQDKGAEDFPGEESGGSDSDAGNPGKEKDAVVFRIVDGAESGSLVLAGEDRGSVYTLFVQGGEIPIYLDGQQTDYTALEDGMPVEVSFRDIMETFPGQLGQVSGIWAYSLGTERNPGGGYYDLCGLYLQVLNDLWDKDPGLNEEISYVSVDLSDAPGGLTEGEKEAVAWIFACGHNVEGLSLTYEELAERGYLTEVDEGSFVIRQWEDGVLFTITPYEQKESMSSLPQLNFDAEKWRSPVGAYYLMDCNVTWPQMGTWEGYEVGMEAIS